MHPHPRLQQLRDEIRRLHRMPERQVLSGLVDECSPDPAVLARIKDRAIGFVDRLRQEKDLSLMEVFLSEYGLSTEEGVALMCLAEALLRVPDTETIDALIEDKIVPSHWENHLGDSSSSLVNASTVALMLVGKVLDPTPPTGVLSILHGAAKRVGEPVIRAAIARAMKMLGKQFVLGRTIEEAVRQGARQQKRGFSFSYDMLGEAAMTQADANGYFSAYSSAIAYLARHTRGEDIRENPGISIKLSALHPRYELPQRARVLADLVPTVRALTRAAKAAGMGLNIDAEEADRLDLSLDVIEAVLSDPELAGWDGFGIVVQAYGKRASAVIDWLNELATLHDRKIMVRLVKGAYWDTEIKRAQIDGVADFPVFTRKAATDVSYICCAQKLFSMTDRIYPQFATHNAHTVAAILELAGADKPFEFQRLHGMGESLLNTVMEQENCRCRIYAPVGAHRDLLAYLVRRLLENGANSSFVNQIVDEAIPAQVVAADPFEILAKMPDSLPAGLVNPVDLYGPDRRNAHGWDLRNQMDIDAFVSSRAPYLDQSWQASPTTLASGHVAEARPIVNPADPSDIVGTVDDADGQDVDAALSAARVWDAPVEVRAAVLKKSADLFEKNHGEIFALLSREAGKTPADTIAELREAVDFLRYYALEAGNHIDRAPCGIFTCISPWNFPLAIFTGQIAAALAVGNAVLAKPAEATPLIAALAVDLLHTAGVPKTALQLVPGTGAVIGAALVSDSRVKGICFTGSTATAQHINRSAAENLSPHVPLIAETGGINAMIVDSTALAEQAVRDIVASAFQSAGQRCSALRMLYVQADVADEMLTMLYGAMDELLLADPRNMEADIGPVIDQTAFRSITDYIEKARRDGRVLKQLSAPRSGYFVSPAVISVTGIDELAREIFGPVLHVATFEAGELDKVIDAVNASGYGLTFGLHTRINERVAHVKRRIRVGNLYINRNQIGAIVGSQPFGGEGLSGTGPKAGGPHYLARFCKSGDQASEMEICSTRGAGADIEEVQQALDQLERPNEGPLTTVAMPGPTGEINDLSSYPRGSILCLGPTVSAALSQAQIARQFGCPALIVVPGSTGPDMIDGFLERDALGTLEKFAGVALWGDVADQKRVRRVLAGRTGPLIPLLTSSDMGLMCQVERHVCIDTTAAGGNASLLGAAPNDELAKQQEHD